MFSDYYFLTDVCFENGETTFVVIRNYCIFCYSPQNAGTVVKNVERDRNAAGDVQLLSPNKVHKPPPSTPSGGSPRFAKKILESSVSSLDESFEKVFSVNVAEQSSPSKRDKNESCSDSSEFDESSSSPKQTTKLERSMTLTERTLDRPETSNDNEIIVQQPLSSSLSLPVLVQTSSAEETSTPKVSPKSCLPPSLVASVDSATLEARERVLASLKEKVRRVDVGPVQDEC